MVSTQVLGRQAAERFRAQHGLGEGPVGDLVGVIEESTGIDVAIVAAPSEEHGLTMSDPVRRVTFIAVAASNNPMRQRSTLAHELSHVVHGDGGLILSKKEGGRRPAPERLADAFARHLLVPRQAILRVIENHDGPWSEADLSHIVRKFLVSPAIAAVALSEAGGIDDDLKEAWKRIWTPDLATRHGWGDYYAALQEESRRTRPPRQLLARAVEGYQQGVVSLQEISALRGMLIEVVEAELESAGLHPPSQEPAWSGPEALTGTSSDLADLDALLHDEGGA